MDQDRMAARLACIAGVVGVTLGGSRARGDADASSDVDLGVYYRGELDIAGVRRLAAELDPAGTVSERGGWGPWVDGGAWLVAEGTRVDWIYRDLDRVDAVWADCRAGRVDAYGQVGHPHGFWSPAYAGELALGRLLADPTGELGRRQGELHYPDALRDALRARGLWEAGFSLEIAAKAAVRGDVAHVAGCVYRAVGCLVQAIHADARRWVTNEKGSVRAAAALPGAPDRFEARVGALLGALGTGPAELRESLATAAALLAETQNGGQGTAGQSPDGSG
jgi:hypothetical protein